MAERATRVDILFGLAYPDSRVRRAATALATAGYEVRVLAWDRTATRPSRYSDGSIRVEHARIRSHGGRGLAQLAFLARVVRGHLTRMRADPPDVVHAVDLPMLAAALTIRPFIGLPRLVYDAFEIYSVMESHKYPRWLISLIAYAERRLPRAADLVITPGEGRREYFAARGLSSSVVGNWIDPPRAARAAKTDGAARAAARRELGIDADAFCIVYAGGLEPSRDLDPLLEHARRNPTDVVLIAGRGEQEAAIAAIADELPNVRFLGWLPDPARLYTAADALYYALAPDHPYARHPAPNNLYAAIAWAVPLLHRGQGEIATVAATSEIGARFGTSVELDAAVDELRDPARAAVIRAALRALQATYSARRAAEVLLAAYPLPPRIGTDAR